MPMIFIGIFSFKPITMKAPILFFFGLTLLASCAKKEIKSAGTFERIDPAFEALIPATATAEVIAKGYDWSEGPLWVEKEKMLLFSDVPKNIVYKWTADGGAVSYLTPSGFTGDSTRSNEPGSNGLSLDLSGNLLLCQHGDRRIAQMSSDLLHPKSEFISLAATYQGKRFNSPNDLAVHSSGAIFFTDPPYGLEKHTEDPDKEIPFQGVYSVSKDGKVRLLVDTLTRPNGIALSPDQKKLYVANSDPDKAKWYEFTLTDSLTIGSGKVFYDATPNTKSENGLPDGMKVDSKGNLYCSGPGGMWVFNSEGKVIGKFKIAQATSNVALANDNTIFLTCDSLVVRIK
jgi:gluconolactonase